MTRALAQSQPALVRVPPVPAFFADEDAEEAVLSAMLMDPAAVVEARTLLKPRSFFTPKNGQVFAAVCNLDDEDVPIDPIVLSDRLLTGGAFDDAKDFVGHLIDVVPTAANVAYHARIVARRAEERAFVLAASAVEVQLAAGARIEDVRVRLVEKLDALGVEEAGERPFPVLRLLEGEPIAPSAAHVADLLIDRDINLVNAFGGEGKSIILHTIAVCTVIGLPVFGTLQVHRPGNVVLAVPEDGQGGARMILDAIIAGLGLSATQRATVSERIIMISDEASINLATDTHRLSRTVRDHNGVLLLLDPLGNMLAGESDNENAIADKVCAALRRDVCRAAGATVLISTHNRKPGKEQGGSDAPSKHDTRGGGGWVNGARMVFSVSKRENRLTMTCTKSNRLRTGTRHELDLAIETDPNNKAHWLTCRVTDANAGANSESLTPGIGRSLNANERTTLSCLDDQHEPGKRVSWSGWRDGTGLNENTWRSIKTRLLDAGLAEAIKTGRQNRNGSPDYVYQLTPNGRTALSSGWVTERSNGEGVRSGE